MINWQDTFVQSVFPRHSRYPSKCQIVQQKTCVRQSPLAIQKFNVLAILSGGRTLFSDASIFQLPRMSLHVFFKTNCKLFSFEFFHNENPLGADIQIGFWNSTQFGWTSRQASLDQINPHICHLFGFFPVIEFGHKLFLYLFKIWYMHRLSYLRKHFDCSDIPTKKSLNFWIHYFNNNRTSINKSGTMNLADRGCPNSVLFET
mmetsp:Transcript_35750/g.73131  ORF Transcript_35750/g.73131 Transcript_35750/m.73131 type:complete len:203 (+) Transcript_35750:758-1366(+)